MAKYKIHYTLTHANGTLVSSSGDAAFEFEIGDGQLDPCLESCVKTCVVGKLQTFLLSAGEAFGQNISAAITQMQRSEFGDMQIELGSVVEFKTTTDESYIGSIEKIDGDDIRVNFNHPLAGCGVSFQVKILQKIP